MRIIDELLHPPAPPAPPEPTPPAMPYDARMFRYGAGEGREMLTKVYPNGAGGELLTPDEIIVWEAAQRLRRALGGEAVGPPPVLPYTVQTLRWGAGEGVPYQCKVYNPAMNRIGGEAATPDEAAAWAHLVWLEAQVAAKDAVAPEEPAPDPAATEPHAEAEPAVKPKRAASQGR